LLGAGTVIEKESLIRVKVKKVLNIRNKKDCGSRIKEKWSPSGLP